MGATGLGTYAAPGAMPDALLGAEHAAMPVPNGLPAATHGQTAAGTTGATAANGLPADDATGLTSASVAGGPDPVSSHGFLPCLSLHPGTRGEPGEAFWVNHIRASTVLYALCNMAVWVYLALTPRDGYRLLIFSVAVFGLASAVVVDRFRQAIARSDRHLQMLYAWSLLTYSFVTLISALDGGVTSPLCLLLFIALSYISLAYPPRAVLAFTALAVCVYLGLAAGSSASGAFVQLSASMLGLCGVLGAFAAANQWRQRAALAELAARLERQAATDQLTGCLNRRTFHDRLANALTAAHAAGEPVSLLFVDIDHFKAINDTYGHLAGDEVLARIGAVLIGTRWAHDAAAGRIGGDEFALLLPGARPEAAQAIGKQIHGAVRGRPMSIPTPVTVSVGIGSYPATAATLADLYNEADRSLYSVKWAGRDGVATVNPSEPAA